MLKRLIEVALPLKEVSEQSAREKSIRHGHISTLHIWWARRPLAACRAVVFASLIPDPDDPECPEKFRRLVMDVLGSSQFRPKNGDGAPIEDTPRTRCLEFIKHLVRWENSNNPEYIEPARRLIAAAHKFLHPDSDSKTPKVLDPFAGGGAIPLEALRLGCEAHAIELNPVAHLIELCTLVYPQKYGRPDSRPVPDYIKRLIAHNRAKKKRKGQADLFDQDSTSGGTGVPPVTPSQDTQTGGTGVPDVKMHSGGTGVPDVKMHSGGTGVPPVKAERRFRRNLPHIQIAGHTYFLTWRCREGITLSPHERSVALNAVRHWHGVKWQVIAAVVMPDHVHVLATPLPKAEGVCDLSEILHSVKSFSAHQINKARGREGPVWLDETYDRVVRDEAELEEKYDYIRNNPIKNGLAQTTADYPWLIDQEEHRRDAGATLGDSPAKGDFPTGDTAGGTGVSPVAPAQRPLGPDDIIPDVEITEAEYRKNPLAADVKYWGHWVLEKARREIGKFYPPDPDGSVPVAYLWARTVKCPNPTCGATIPLIRQLWLCKKPKRKVALKMVPGGTGVPPVTGSAFTGGTPVPPSHKVCRFEVVEGRQIDFDPTQGTMQRGNAACPFCQQTAPVEYLREECRAGRMGQQMIAVISTKRGSVGKRYRHALPADDTALTKASEELARLRHELGHDIVPHEPLPPVGTLGFRVNNYGLLKWGSLFNARQLLALVSFVRGVRVAIANMKASMPDDYVVAVGSFLALAVSRFADFNSSLCVLNVVGGRGVVHTFGRQALPMVWDYAESAPFNEQGANWDACIEAAVATVSRLQIESIGSVLRGSADRLPTAESSVAAVVTDPPYYDAVPYADLSDFFYVWLKRAAATIHPELVRTPLAPKRQEMVSHLNSEGGRKDAAGYEEGMRAAFREMHRVLADKGVCVVMFAHKTTSAWETLINGLLRERLSITGSWPFRTERPGRLRAQGSAALASSVTLVCRKRDAFAKALTRGGTGVSPVKAALTGQRPVPPNITGLWDDVRQELKAVAQERLDFFWDQGIRGADFFISAIGPALSVFGKYERVTRLSGDEVTVGQFLDEVRALVTSYALEKILKTTHTARIDPESRFYVVWKWSYGEAKVPADESFKMAQALGIDTEQMWDRTGVLVKSGETVQALPVAKRMKMKHLGEPVGQASGLSEAHRRDAGATRPGSLIDVLHRLCQFREKGDNEGMARFLARSGHAENPTLWLVAQAISEILPDGDKEKQLMQGLLNQREGLERATRQGELF